MTTSTQEPWRLPEIIAHTRRILDSFAHWTSTELGPFRCEDALEQSKRLFEAPFPVLTQGTGQDPMFDYANRAALVLYEYSWEEIHRLLSKASAEPALRAERAQAIAQAMQQGFMPSYSGTRVSRTGRRILVENACLWNILDESGKCIGQAAALHSVTPLGEMNKH